MKYFVFFLLIIECSAVGLGVLDTLERLEETIVKVTDFIPSDLFNAVTNVALGYPYEVVRCSNRKLESISMLARRISNYQITLIIIVGFWFFWLREFSTFNIIQIFYSNRYLQSSTIFVSLVKFREKKTFQMKFSGFFSKGAVELSIKIPRPLITPNASEINFVLMTKKKNITGKKDFSHWISNFHTKLQISHKTVPMDDPQKMWSLEEFNPDYPLVMVIQGWTMDYKDNYLLNELWPAYRCCRDVNFVVCFYCQNLIFWSISAFWFHLFNSFVS